MQDTIIVWMEPGFGGDCNFKNSCQVTFVPVAQTDVMAEEKNFQRVSREPKEFDNYWCFLS